MATLINQVDTMVAESLDGLCAAHSDILVLGGGRKFVRRRDAAPNKVAVISGGGAGHEPLDIGFVGHGMLDAACPGDVFFSPTPDQMIDAVEAVAGDAGVLLIVKNERADVMNFEATAETVAELGHEVQLVRCSDDLAGEADKAAARRGAAGTIVVQKIVGAAAEDGMPLMELQALGDRVNANTRSIGVATRGPTAPATGEPAFVAGAGEVAFGVDIRGKPGPLRKLSGADAIAGEMMASIIGDLDVGEGEALLLVNGFGGTSAIALNIMHHAARAQAEKHGLTVTRSLVGNYVTSLDMAGCSLTLSLLDEETKRLWDAPVHTPALRWGA